MNLMIKLAITGSLAFVSMAITAKPAVQLSPSEYNIIANNFTKKGIIEPLVKCHAYMRKSKPSNLSKQLSLCNNEAADALNISDRYFERFLNTDLGDNFIAEQYFNSVYFSQSSDPLYSINSYASNGNDSSHIIIICDEKCQEDSKIRGWGSVLFDLADGKVVDSVFGGEFEVEFSNGKRQLWGVKWFSSHAYYLKDIEDECSASEGGRHSEPLEC